MSGGVAFPRKEPVHAVPLRSTGSCRRSRPRFVRRAGRSTARVAADGGRSDARVDRPAGLRSGRRSVRRRHAGGRGSRARCHGLLQGRRTGHQGRQQRRSEDRRAARYRRGWDHGDRPGRASDDPPDLRFGDAWAGGGAAAALVRIDGAGELALVPLAEAKYTKAELPNAPAANPADRRNPRQQSITDMAYIDGRLYRRRTVERGVRVEAAVGRRTRSQTVDAGTERRDLPRQPRSVRDAIAGLRLRAVQDQRPAAPHRRLSLHAARQVPDRQL